VFTYPPPPFNGKAAFSLKKSADGKFTMPVARTKRQQIRSRACTASNFATYLTVELKDHHAADEFGDTSSGVHYLICERQNTGDFSRVLVIF